METETRDEFSFAGQTAIVTGGNGGIGQGIVTAFSERDANVVIADSAPALKPLVSAGDGQILDIRTDITRRDSVDALVRETVARFGRIDVLVNNAGGGLGVAEILDVTPEQIDWLIRLNIYGTLHCTQAVAKAMVKQGHGAIVNISSAAAMNGAAGQHDPVYAGCKGFMHSLGKALAINLGKYNVRINTIAPGWIVPEHDDQVSEGSFWVRLGEQFGTPETFRAEYARTGKLHASIPPPLRQLGCPRDIANAAVYLASDASRHSTGQLLSICGGVNMPS